MLERKGLVLQEKDKKNHKTVKTMGGNSDTKPRLFHWLENLTQICLVSDTHFREKGKSLVKCRASVNGT